MLLSLSLSLGRRLHTKTPSPSLALLVKSREYEKASTLLDTLDLNTVPHSTNYEAAALQMAETDTNLMAKFLSLYPAGIEPPQTFLAHILNDPKPHILHRVGLILASKGYHSVVKDKILPNLTNYEALDVRWALEPNKLEISTEDAFESEEEYEDSYASSTMADVPTTSLAALHNLLQEEGASNYAAARRLIDDLIALQVPIPPDRIFERPAALALSSTLAFSAEDRISEFEFWFKYYPHGHGNRSFPFLHPCIHSNITSLPLMKVLILLLAEKGYYFYINRHILPPLIRYGLPDESMRLFHHYISHVERSHSPKLARTALNIAIRHFVGAGHISHAISLVPESTSSARKVNTETLSLLLSRLDRQDWIDRIQDLIKDREIPLRSLEMGRFKTDPSWKPHIALREIKSALRSRKASGLPSIEDLVQFFITYISLRSGTHQRSNAIFLLHSLAQRVPFSYRATSHLLHAHMVLLFRLGTSAHNLTSYHSSIPPCGPLALTTLLILFQRFFLLQGVPRKFLIEAIYKQDRNDLDEDITLESQFYLKSLSSLPIPNPNDPFPLLFPTRLHISLVWQSLAFLSSSRRNLGNLWAELIRFASPEAELETFSDPLPNSFSPQLYPTLQTPKSWTSRGRRIAAPDNALSSSLASSSSLSWTARAHASPIIAECFTPFIMKLMRASVPIPASFVKGVGYASTSNDDSLGIDSPTYVLRTLTSLNLSPTVYHYTEMARWWAWNGEERKVWIVLARLEEKMDRVDREQAELEVKAKAEAEERVKAKEERREAWILSQSGGIDAGDVVVDDVDVPPTANSPSGEEVDDPNLAEEAEHDSKSEVERAKDVAVLRAVIETDGAEVPTLSVEPVDEVDSNGHTSSPSSLQINADTSPDNTLPSPDLTMYIALMRAFLSSPNYRDGGSGPDAPTNDDLDSSLHLRPGTKRRLRAVDYLYKRMEQRFGAEAVRRELEGSLSDGNLSSAKLKNPNNEYLKGVISDWRALAGVKEGTWGKEKDMLVGALGAE